MTLAEKAEQLRDTAMALRPTLVPEYQSIAVPTSTDPAQLECIDLPEITEDVGPAEFIHMVKGRIVKGIEATEAVILTSGGNVSTLVDIARKMEETSSQPCVKFHRDPDGRIDGVTLCIAKVA